MTDKPDTKAIRAQMKALEGFSAGPWRDEGGVIQSQTTVWQNGVKQVGWDYATIRAEVTDDWDQAANARLIAAAPDMHATILALCDALDAERAEVGRIGRDLNMAKYGQPDFAWGIHLEAMAELKAENERLRTELAWYGAQSRLARIIHSKGNAGRHALQADGGNRARAALAQKGDQK